MGVSAVPGSGKTQVLSRLAADLIHEDYVNSEQEILVVTLVNSAVDNFTNRIDQFVKEYGILPGMGYRVRTLHGLAHDIVRERPDLIGISDAFEVIDESQSDDILERASQAWLKANPNFILDYSSPSVDDPIRNKSKDWLDLVKDTGKNFIRQAKDLEATPSDVSAALNQVHNTFPLLEMGLSIYTDYQRALNYRGAVDFDDLIRLALRALKLDPDYLARLRSRWPYILEDEAQDSNRLQEEILRLLVGENGNWVRVGDPNQAIYETFTTASPRYLQNFMREPGVVRHDLPNSGRSTRSIIELANYLIEWTMNEHPNPALRDALTTPLIDPTPPGDPQPNPTDAPGAIFLSGEKYDPDRELRVVVSSLRHWLPEHPDSTVAVLVPRNTRGAKLVEELRKANIDVVELLRSSQSTRQAAGALTAVLRCLADPANPQKLAGLVRELHRRELDNPARKDIVVAAGELVRKCTRLEDFTAPLPGSDWLETPQFQGVNLDVLNLLADLRASLTRWQAAVLLPIDQLVLTIARELFDNPIDLALSHKLALVLERAARLHPDWNLDEFTHELDEVAQNKRKFNGFSDDDLGFNPDNYKGKVVVATVHKAKGLEWDRIYLMSVNNYDFPSADPYDSFISERWFVRDHLNLTAETLAQLTALLQGDVSGLYLEEGAATQQARIEYASERLRLLFVAITRARKELAITWNTGQRSDSVQAQPLVKLREFWEGRSRENQN
jgi:DNA helicase-2/ATP-dependent DNA helicase PcrA